MREALGFDDVLLVPKKSTVESRKLVDTTTLLTRKITLAIPIVSANMVNVTEAKMAIAMAREGGFGIIHRFMPIEQRVAEVEKVKRAESIVIDAPYQISKDASVEEAARLMEKLGVSGLIVTEDGKLEGIVTKRDIRFEEGKRVEEVMTKKQDLIYAHYGITLEEAKEMLRKHRIEKLPLVDEEGRVRGLITAKDLMKMKEHPYATKDSRGRLMVGCAVGVKEDYIEAARRLLDAGCDLIAVDIAHGHSDLAINAVKNLRREFGDRVQILAGNVATAEGTSDLIDAGADCVKVGIGSGSICSTRIVTGAGVPQITAIMDCAKVAKKEGIPIMADGGIKNSGDIVKALAANASTVMLGALLAGCEESPGITVMRNGRKFKFYKGMASVEANIERRLREMNEVEENLVDFVPEGIEAFIPYRGTVSDVLKQLVGGLRSGMSYCGAKNIKELQERAEFIKVSRIKETLPEEMNFR